MKQLWTSVTLVIHSVPNCKLILNPQLTIMLTLREILPNRNSIPVIALIPSLTLTLDAEEYVSTQIMCKKPDLFYVPEVHLWTTTDRHGGRRQTDRQSEVLYAA